MIGKNIAPLPVKILYILLVTPFFIYIPISFFKNDIFLVTLDASLLLGLLLTITNKKTANRIFSGLVSMKALIYLYVINVMIIFILDVTTADRESVKVVRNLLFGVGVFALSSAWITTQQRVDTVVKLLFYCVMLTSFYGYRQFFFGFMQFELDRLAIMGSSIYEMESMGRARITSSFGDPLLFGFYMMVGLFVLLLARPRNIACAFIRNGYSLFFIIIIGSLILSLTRAPVVGMIFGLLFLIIFNIKTINRQTVFSAGCILIVVIVVLNIISSVTESYELNDTFQNIKFGIDSLFSVYLMVSGTGDSGSYFLVDQSRDARLDAWQSGLDFLYSHPFGGGLSDTSHYMFSPIDVGLLSIGLKIGVFGMIVMLIIILLVAIISFNHIRRIPNDYSKYEGYIFLSLWISIIVTLSISDLFSSSAASIVIWIIAGILLNQKLIYNSRITTVRLKTGSISKHADTNG